MIFLFSDKDNVIYGHKGVMHGNVLFYFRQTPFTWMIQTIECLRIWDTFHTKVPLKNHIVSMWNTFPYPCTMFSHAILELWRTKKLSTQFQVSQLFLITKSVPDPLGTIWTFTTWKYFTFSLTFNLHLLNRALNRKSVQFRKENL